MGIIAYRGEWGLMSHGNHNVKRKVGIDEP